MTAAPSSSVRDEARANRLATVVARWSLPALLVLVLLAATVTTPSFFTFDNMRGILINCSVIGIVAVGMTPLTLSGNLVSLGANQSTMLGAVSFIALESAGLSLLPSALCSLALLLVIGLAQGLIVAAGLNPMITTLAAGSIIFGVTTLATGGAVVSAQDGDFRWIALSSLLGIPIPIWIFAGFTAIMTVFTNASVPGRKLVLSGANRAAASLSGISHRRATILAFLLLSVGATIGGIIVASQTGQATSDDLKTLSESVIAAVLVGGTAIQGGYGSPLRSAIGAVIIAIFTNVMVLHDFPQGVRLASVGALVLIVVISLHVLKKKAV